MDELEMLMLLKRASGGKPLVEYTATGNPLTFNTNKAKPLKSLLIPWTPSQSGSGDPSPSNVRPISGVSAVNVWRTGANLIDDSKRYQYGAATLFVGATDDGYSIPLKAGKYTFSCEFSGGVYYSAYIREKNASGAQTIWSSSRSISSATFTLASDGIYRINFYQSGMDFDKIGHCWLNYGESASEYSPYTGSTVNVTFPALGKNLLNPATLEQGSINESGAEAVNSARVRCGFIPVVPGKTYTVSATGFTAFMHIYDANKGSLGANRIGTNITMPGNAAFVRCFFRNADNTDISPSDIVNAMCEEGSSATAYEPYTNTVYGGSLDLTTGVLTVEWAYLLLNDPEQWASSSGTQDFICNTMITDRKTFPTSYEGLICSSFPVNNGSNKAYMRWTGSSSFKVGIKNSNTSYTLEDIQQMASDGYIAIAYALAEPVTYQLTPQQITALIGDNTIWSDTNGSNTAVYYKRG